MKKNSVIRKITIVILFSIICVFQSGCALLSIPGEVVSETFKILGTVVGGTLEVLKKIPLPPTGFRFYQQ